MQKTVSHLEGGWDAARTQCLACFEQASRIMIARGLLASGGAKANIMPYWKCYYHIVWATKHRQPAIIPAYEPIITGAIEAKCEETGVSLLAVNMVSDHIHMAASIPPSFSISKWIGSVKGVTARAINTSFERDTRFHWQGGYGVMSFGETALDKVRAYVVNQKQHHAKGDVNRYLENVGDED